MVQADTIRRWHRELVKGNRSAKNKQKTGRPPTDPKVVELVLRMSRENLSWGYKRIERCASKPRMCDLFQHRCEYPETTWNRTSANTVTAIKLEHVSKGSHGCLRRHGCLRSVRSLGRIVRAVARPCQFDLASMADFVTATEDLLYAAMMKLPSFAQASGANWPLIASVSRLAAAVCVKEIALHHRPKTGQSNSCTQSKQSRLTQSSRAGCVAPVWCCLRVTKPSPQRASIWHPEDRQSQELDESPVECAGIRSRESTLLAG